MGVLEGMIPKRPATGTVISDRGHPFRGYSAGDCLWPAVPLSTFGGASRTTSRPLFRGLLLSLSPPS